MKPEKRKKIKVIDKGNVYKPKKRTNKDLLVLFEPLTEEQQKDLLFHILDNIDFYEKKTEKAKTEEDKLVFFERYAAYRFFSAFLTRDPAWMGRSGISLGGSLALELAHRDRLAWEASAIHQ